MKTKTIKQTIIFKASPLGVYDALMDSTKHAAFTGDTAKISRKVGGKFAAYGGYALGENLELVPGKKIVQRWRANDWSSGIFSRVTFLLEKGRGGTQLTFIQEGVPEEQHEAIAEGWKEYYWDNMKKTFGW